MVIGHTLADGVLQVRLLRELDITTRAAAALEIEALVAAHRPDQVLVELPSPVPSPATFSALARARRMCQSLGIPLTATGPGADRDRRTTRPAPVRETGSR
ncbi:hypothetical protein EAO71_33440 [Streptomyces sp. ms191]|uniref:hypothetical protein n=1 Tax=unclassified Streptomyces TaxID=2593676 RepID=UPI0011CD65BB|nr:hypothetical protein [Streptomyces sp. ms191]TXS19856.1 hypothetical protein EAO71_33440 [Streptomyces sp. ms191]